MPIATRRRLIKNCDPQRPLPPGDPMYVELDAAPPTRGDRSWVELLRETILLSEDSCQLFSGFQGTGKTTELLRLKGELERDEEEPSHVVFINFTDYVDTFSPINVVDVVRVLAYCLDRAATVAEGKDPEVEPGYLRRLFDFISRHDVELQKIGFAAYGSSMMLEVRNNPKFRERLEEAVLGRFQAFVEEAREFMERAVARILNAERIAARKVERLVVIADGLEKVAPLREEDRALMEGSIEALFINHADLLKLRSCHVIYTFPLWLRFHAAHLGAVYGREPLVLPMVKIADPEGADYEPGLERLRTMVARRVEDLGAVFGDDPEATLGALIRASGGYPRDLLRMVRTLLLEARSLPVVRADVDRVIADLARTYEDTILGEYVGLLARVHQTHELPRDNAAERALAGYLFQRWLILAYRNGAEWYELHPLVLRSPRVQRRLAEPAT